VAYADGSEAVRVADGYAPAWSPSGGSLAFSWLECDFYYYYGCNKRGIVTLRLPGGFAVLTQDTTDADPAWRPDGGAIAFSRNGVLHIVNADGGSLHQLISTAVPDLRHASQPAWSPDATKIAFACEIDQGTEDICVVAADGTGFVRLMADAALDWHPSWSPDGSRIAFVTTATGFADSQIALMSSEGGAITRLTAGTNPAWSRDGTKLLFEGVASRGIFMLTVSSGTVVRLTSGDDHNPAWRP
jgi:TolB protein